jgi:hypothetical protein
MARSSSFVANAAARLRTIVARRLDEVLARGTMAGRKP